MPGIWGGRVTGNQQLGIRKNAEKSYGDFSAFFMLKEGEGRTIPLSSFYPEGGRGGNDDIPTP